MKKIISTTVLLIALYPLLAQQPNYAAAERYDAPNLLKQFGTLEVIPHFINGSDKFWYLYETADGQRNYFLTDPAIKQNKLAYDKTSLAEKLSALTKEKADTALLNFVPVFSGEGNLMLFTYKKKNYSYNIANQVLTERLNEKKERDTAARPVGSISADKAWQLYSRRHNLYLKKINVGAEIKLSSDAERYHSFGMNEGDTLVANNSHPNADWVPGTLFFYSLRKDNRKVKTVSLARSSSLRPWVQTIKYEHPGDKDVVQFELFVGNAETGIFKSVDITKWPDQDVQVINPKSSAKELFFTRKRRTRDEIELCAVDLSTGNVRVVINESSKPYINNDMFSLSVLNGGKDILLWSDRTGWGHYYLYDEKGKLKNQVTSGNWTAGKIVYTDTAKREIYFYGYGKEEGRNPYLQHLYKVSFDGKKQALLTPENAHHEIFFSPTGNYFIDNYSRIDLLPKTVLRTSRGEWITDVAQPDLTKLFAYGWKMPEPFSVKAADGSTDLYGILWKPYDFDSTKTYPLISQVYPGPFIETVWPDFTVIDKYNNTSLAQVGFIVVVMGHRGGSPLRNKAYAQYGYGNLRDYALADDRHGLQQLARRFHFIDSTRIGIFGHSGGGAMAATAICTYPDFYKVAVASSGNHDNNSYFRSWGENYNGIQEVKDSTTGKTSFQFKVQTNQLLAKNLKGHLLLVTGDADDNVLPSQTSAMADALMKAGKDFDMLVLPGQGHHYEGLYKTYFENRLRHYFGKYLMEEINKQ